MVKPPKPKKERKSAAGNVPVHSASAASSLFVASSDSPPHLPQPLLSDHVPHAPKWRSREVLVEEDESESRTRREKRRSPLWREMIEETSASEVIDDVLSGELLQETREISTKVAPLHPSLLTTRSCLLFGSLEASQIEREATLSQSIPRINLLLRILTLLLAALVLPAAPFFPLRSTLTNSTISSTHLCELAVAHLQRMMILLLRLSRRNTNAVYVSPITMSSALHCVPQGGTPIPNQHRASLSHNASATHLQLLKMLIRCTALGNTFTIQTAKMSGMSRSKREMSLWLPFGLCSELSLSPYYPVLLPPPLFPLRFWEKSFPI